jgi:hypothetical protein
MDRKVDDRTILDKFVEDFVRVVEKHSKYIIVSGFVAIAHGRSRGTEDIDLIIEKIPREKYIQLHEEIVEAGFECMQSASGQVIYDNYLLGGDSVRYTKNKNFAPPEMEVKMAKDELDNYQLLTRKKFPFTGLDVYFSSIEMNIAFKEEYLKTDKDMEDARHLRIIYREQIDEKEIERVKKEINRLRMKKG